VYVHGWVWGSKPVEAKMQLKEARAIVETKIFCDDPERAALRIVIDAARGLIRIKCYGKYI
jgi:hypothetical protein